MSRITIYSLAKCLNLESEKVKEIFKDKIINNFSYYYVESLVKKYRGINKASSFDKKVIGNKKRIYIRKETMSFDEIRHIVDMAFKPLYTTILNKYNNKCVICGNSKPQIHHIDRNHTNMVFSNLIPLCFSCHKKEHSSYFIPKTQKDFEKVGEEYNEDIEQDKEIEKQKRFLDFINNLPFSNDKKEMIMVKYYMESEESALSLVDTLVGKKYPKIL